MSSPGLEAQPLSDDHSPVRVLIADDSTGVRRLVRLVLDDCDGVNVVAEASDGAEALAMVDAVRPDVVLLDVAMPVMDGLETLRKIRQRYGETVPVVMLSSFAESRMREQAVELGAVGYVEKSGDLNRVIATVRGAALLPSTSAPVGRIPTQSPSPDAEMVPEAAEPQPRKARRKAWSAGALSGAAMMFVAVMVARQMWGDQLTVLFVVPIAVMAVAFGVRGGLVAAATGVLLFAVADAPKDDLGIEYLTHIVAFGLVAATAGWYSDHARRQAAERARDARALTSANRRLAQAMADKDRAIAEKDRAMAEKDRAMSEKDRAIVEKDGAVEALESTNADLRQFGYVASHDLAEPLRTMSGFAELLAAQYGARLDDTGRAFLGHITAGADRMRALITDLHAYTRASQQELRRERVELGPLVDDVIASLAVPLDERNATVRVLGTLPVVVGDRSMLGLVVQNLISNGIKFNASDKPLILVSGDAGPDWATLSVADNGIGIRPQHRQRVFELFQRLHTREEYPGTGLGLAICQRIVRRHTGRIRLTSAPGVGTTFSIDLPTGNDAAAPRPSGEGISR